MEWNSIRVGLPLLSEGIWPAPTNAEEDALCRIRVDCMQAQSLATQHCAFRTYNTGSAPPSGSASSAQSGGGSALNYGHWPVLTWQPSAAVSPDTHWLFSEDGYMWVSCIIQWLEALRTVIAWRLYVALMQLAPLIADQEPEMDD